MLSWLATPATPASSFRATSGPERRIGGKSVHRAAVEVTEPEHLRDHLGHGALAGRRRAIDRDDGHRPRHCHRSELLEEFRERLGDASRIIDA